MESKKTNQDKPSRPSFTDNDDMSPSWDSIFNMALNSPRMGAVMRAKGINNIEELYDHLDSKKQKPNEQCKCGSGRKYKKCCGQR